MRLKSIEFRNFMSFGELQRIEFEPKKCNIIVGPNNGGKTNVFRALTLIGKELSDYRGRGMDVFPYFSQQEDVTSFDIFAEIEFEPDELDVLINFCICSVLMKNESAIISGQQSNKVDRIKIELLSKHGRKMFEPLFTKVKLHLKAEKREGFTVYTILTIDSEFGQFFIYDYGNLSNTLENRGSYQTIQIGEHLLVEYRNKDPSAVDNYLTALSENESKIPEIEIDTPNIFKLLSQPSDYRHVIDLNGFTMGDLERKFGNIPPVNALRNFVGTYERRSGGIDIFSAILNLIYNRSLVRISDIRSRPRSYSECDINDYVKNVQNFTGEELAYVLFDLKINPDNKKRERYNQISQKFKLMTSVEFDIVLEEKNIKEKREEINFIPYSQLSSESNIPLSEVKVLVKGETEVTKKKSEPTIQIKQNNIIVPLEFSAAGLFEILLLLTVVVAQEKKIILLDEPALNLHPMVQLRFIDLLKDVSSNNQIIMITHSPYLVMPDLYTIWRLSLTNGHTTCHNLGKIVSSLNDKAKEKLQLKFGKVETRSILFSKGIIFAEGLADKLVIEMIDKHLSTTNEGAFIENNEFSILYGDGKEDLGNLINLANIMKIPFCGVFDYDALMAITGHISHNKHIKTSAVFKYLYNTNLLTTEEIQIISNLEGEIKPYDGTYYYPVEKFSELLNIAESHRMFIFKTDLEGALLKPVAKRESKPLQDVKRAIELIENQKIPDEFRKLTGFIRSKLD